MDLPEFFLVLCLLIPLSITNSSPRNEAVLENNGYENIVVAISPDVPDYQDDSIIQNIQHMIRRASSVLFEATKKRAYFRRVQILIPDTWEDIQAKTADIRVDVGNWLHGDMPFTVQSGGCGQPGEYIHISPAYLLSLFDAYNIAMYGPPEKVFVHQWARYRYGVFEESGIQGDMQYPLFFKNLGYSKIEPNFCSDTPPSFTVRDVVTQGPCRIDPSTGIYDENCIFELQPNFLPTSSLMSLVPQSLVSTTYFCEDDQERRHVYEAPTKHNAMCSSKSVNAVISQHQDFATNKPVQMVSVEPTFEIVRSGGSRFILLMDTSGSMKDYNRIQKLYDSARRWIKFDISDGSRLGMVQFSTQAVVLSPLVTIDGDQSREKLIGKLPRVADGWTCIGCGLLKSLEVLSQGGKGGVIVLITDGEETNAPYIKDVLPKMVESGIRVVSIAFGMDAADKIEELAEKTNGKSYFISDSDTGQGLSDAFIGSLTYQPAVSSDRIVVLLFQEEYRTVPTGATRKFAVDFTVGRNFVFRIDYTNRAHIRSFKIVSPDGMIYSQLQFDDAAKVAFFKLDSAMIGIWNFSLEFSSSTSDSASVQITAQTREGILAPITSECYVPDGLNVLSPTATPVRILAKVLQGSNPVVRAKVRAYVGLPNGTVEITDLYDDGAGADTTRDDGIYSRYFVTVNYVGRYTVQCQVWDDGSAYINDGFILNRENRNRFRRDLSATNATKTGPFSRKSDGGSFKIVETSENRDKYPPSRIKDLTVVAVNNANLTFTLQFTAPGDELDWGTVSTYEVRYSSMYESLIDEHFGIPNADGNQNSTLITQSHIVSGTLKPELSGSRQVATVMWRRNDTRQPFFFVAIRGVDLSGRKGAVSNVVAVDFSYNTVQTNNLSTKSIIGIVIGFSLGILLLAALVYIVVRRRYLTYEEGNTEEKADKTTP